MTQLFHILKKDVRYLRFEFLMYFLFLCFYAWRETYVAPPALIWGTTPQASGYGNELLQYLSIVLITVATVYLIVRLIHADAIPGDSQFWLTRPYSWKSLLGAKVLLLLLGVSLPMFVVRLVIFRIQEFPFFPGIWQLLWSQFVMTMFIVLPLAALAALTSGLTQFVFSVLAVIPIAALVALESYWLRPGFVATMWFRQFIAAAALIALAIWILYSQYRTRRSAFARGVALCACVAIGVMHFFLPWSMAMTVNGWISTPMTATSAPTVELGSRMNFYPEASDRSRNVLVRVPFVVRGIPDGYTAGVDQILSTVEGSGTVDRQFFEPGPFETSPEGKNFRAIGWMDRAFFETERGKSVTVRISFDLILYPPVQTKTILISDNFESVIGELQCRGAQPDRVGQSKLTYLGLTCRSPFHWPEVRFAVLSPGTPYGSLRGPAPTHSPFYGGALSPFSVQTRTMPFNTGANEVTITVQGPPQWYHRDFEFRNVKLGDTMDLR